MKKFITFLLCSCLFNAYIAAQNAIVGTGFSSGWGGSSCPTGNGNFSYFSATGVASVYGATLTAGGTGNRFFRFGIDWSGTTAQRTITIGSDVTVSPGTKYSLNSTCTTSGAMVYNVPNTSYNYVFRTLNAGTNPTGDFVFFEVQGTIRSISNVTRNPSGTVNGGVPVEITATLSGSFSTGQAVFLRYSTDNFATSTVLKMSGSGITYTATIPGVGTNTTVRYYTFTSGDVSSISPFDADLFTININNNGGPNYSYTTSGVMPVELSSFSARKKGNSSVELNWETLTEKDNESFIIERSENAKGFKRIAEIKGAGNTNTIQTYRLIDANPAIGINYYRLKDVDSQGKGAYSKVVAVSISAQNKAIIYPNPVKNNLTLNYESASDESVPIQVFDMLGRLVWSQSCAASIGTNTFDLNLSSLSEGAYFIKVKDDVSRFVKQ